mgnify:CR=1 FL=1
MIFQVVNANLNQKLATKTEYDKVIGEAEKVNIKWRISKSLCEVFRPMLRS